MTEHSRIVKDSNTDKCMLYIAVISIFAHNSWLDTNGLPFLLHLYLRHTLACLAKNNFARIVFVLQVGGFTPMAGIDIGDSLDNHNNCVFSTADNGTSSGCAKEYRGMKLSDRYACTASSEWNLPILKFTYRKNISHQYSRRPKLHWNWTQHTLRYTSNLIERWPDWCWSLLRVKIHRIH